MIWMANQAAANQAILAIQCHKKRIFFTPIFLASLVVVVAQCLSIHAPPTLVF